MSRFHYLFIAFLACLPVLFGSCRGIEKHKRILYDEGRFLKLNVFAPEKDGKLRPVLVFIHGGNWKSGKISTYNFFGKRMAQKGVVTVVVEYRLAADTNYYGMASDAARSVKWVKEHITNYGGDPDKIVISGHSAGGHLAALIAMDNRYFDSLHVKNPIKGAVMVDAFGLNMYNYLLKYQNNFNGIYYPTFSTDQDTWKTASPYYYLGKRTPPFLFFLGGMTYPAIKEDTEDFYAAIKKYQPGALLIHNPRRGHFGMMLQFYHASNKGYKQITDFINEVVK